MRQLGLALVVVACAGGPTHTQTEAPAPVVPPGAKPAHRVPRSASKITIDGSPDEAAWHDALRLELAFEVNPGDNLPAGARTEALLLYDQDNFYAAFVVHDPEPGRVRARLTDRDTAFQDDFVGLIVDTFNDELRAFEFFVNPLGVQMDLVVDDVAGTEDESWDAIWNSAGRLTADGYTAEIAIPYTSLRFQRIQSDQTWGLDLVRIYPRDRRFLYALNRRDRNINCYVCQFTKIVGFDGAEPGRNLEVTPTLTALRTDSRAVDDTFPSNPLEDGDEDLEPGLTVRWGVRPSLTLSGTVNPDFSQVEADVAQLDVNEQFALFYPEKRPFFLEGSDFFESPMQVFYTRTVTDPEWGAKLSGKEGKNVLGVFAAQDDVTNLLFPGSQGSSSTLLGADVIDTVLRYRRDVGKSSTIGALVIARDGEDSYQNAVFGVDGVVRSTETDLVRFQALGSSTQYSEAVAIDFGQPMGDFTSHALDAGYSHDTRNWSAYATYRDIGRDFRADLGFLPQVDIRRPEVGGGYSWWGDPGDWWSRIQLNGNVDQTEDQDGFLIEREYEVSSYAAGPRQLNLYGGFGYRERGYRDELFDQGFVNLGFDMRPTKTLTFGVDSGWSKRIDFAFEDPLDPGAARQGDELRIEPFLRVEPGRHVRLNLSHAYRRLDLDTGRAFHAGLTEMRLTYQINLRAFVRTILQYTDVERGVALYPQCAPGADPAGCDLLPSERDVFMQLLFSYKVNPMTALYLGYTDQQLGFQELTADEVPLTRTARTLFFKIGRAWVL